MHTRHVVKGTLYLIIILLFNVLYFSIIEAHTPARWISYLGIHLSYLLLCVSSLTYSRVDAGGSVVHVYPKMLVAYGYFTASLGCGAILILINNATITFPVIVHGLIISFYVFHYVLLMNAEIHTERNALRDRRDARFIRECSGRLELAMRCSTSREVRRNVERFRDAIDGASIRTIPQVANLEAKICDLVQQVDCALVSENPAKLKQILDEGVALVRERDREIMLHK